MRTLLLLLVISALPNWTHAQMADAGPDTAPSSQSRCTDLEGNAEPCPQPVPPIRKYRASTESSLSVRSVPYDIIHQQARFWTSPARLREQDLRWIFPFTLATTALVVADPTIDKHIAPHTSIVSRSQTFSNVSIAAIIGSAGGMYLWGHFRQNEQMRDTGFMAGEAGLNSFLAATVMKEVAQRTRPMDVVPPGSRGFWQGGSSFPSEHSAAAWSVATVIAHQYPGTGTKLFAYGLAAAISASRVTGRQHFASDAFVGSALGWYIGREVWEGHQVPDAKQWGTFESAPKERERNPESYGSPYVPLDSWVYPAFDRLAALGYVQSAFRDMRPWTRLECARLLDEAEPLISNGDAQRSPDAERIYKALLREFAPEIAQREGGSNTNLVLDSIYSRLEGISGPPLRDGYHFGQTITNDYGRPYGEGLNVVTGASSYATAGPLMAYVRGEYQRAPSAPGIPAASAPIVSAADFGIPASAYPTEFPPVSRFQLMEGYFGLKIGGMEMSFGKQALWWGPTEAGGMLFSNNAEPITMLRISRPKPFKLPSVFGLLGAVRTDFFVGRLSGHDFVDTGTLVGQTGVALNPQPYIHGEKISFKPTPNFEFSIARTTLIAGPDFPFTSHTFFKSLVSFSTSNGGGADPGDRRSSFDFTYRVPKLRNWLLLYADSFTDDEISPLAYPRMSGVNPGIYIPQIPGLRKLDFRMEGAYTPYHLFPGFFYFNVRYLQGYTNNGQLLGNWIGRQGTGIQLWSSYWLSGRSKIQASYRDMRVDRDFLKGGALKDVQIRADLQLRSNLAVTGALQFERWNFPLLSPTTQTNVVSSMQLTYWPHWRIK
jgi:membrane-associated phospholipid phosphatase